MTDALALIILATLLGLLLAFYGRATFVRLMEMVDDAFDADCSDRVNGERNSHDALNSRTNQRNHGDG